MSKRNKNESHIFLKDFDYEKYQLVLPYRFLFGRKRQRFIYSELEKMHPCFSSEFCFDSNMRKVSKKGFVSDVMVIHKNKLAEYEAKRSLSAVGMGRITGTGFFVNSSRHHRFFVNEKLKRVFVAGCFIVVSVLSLFVIAGFVRLNGRANKENLKSFAFDGEQTVHVADGVEESFEVPCEVCKTFFNCIGSAGGRVLSFRWEILNGYEILEAKLKGVFPEQLQWFDIPAVSYEDGLPVIQVNRVVSVGTKNPVLQNGAGSGGINGGSFNPEFYKNIRRVLSVNEAVLKEERLAPYLIRFSCNEKVMGTLLAGVAGCVADAGEEVCSINIMAAGGSSGGATARDFEISIGVEGAAPAPGIDLAVVVENAELFGEINNHPKSAGYIAKEKLPEKNISLEKSEGQKIGEIKTSEGKVIVFYKTSEGKIKKIMEGNKSE